MPFCSLTVVRSVGWAALSLTLLAAGCGRDEVKVYRVAKEESPAPKDPHAMSPEAMPPGHPDINAGSTTPRLTWTLPAGWQEGKAGTMRAASFTVPGKDGQSADVAVIPLPPGGSELDLVNMWRGQMQLAAATAADAEKETEPVTVGGSQGKIFDIASEGAVMEGDKKGRILVAMVNKEGLNWFFKMAGEDSLVREQKPAFLEFLKSVSFAPAAEVQMAAAPHAVSTNVKQVPGEGGGKPHWTVPSGWQEVPGGQFLVAKFNFAGESGAQAAVNVSMSAGEGGGWLANVNRWRLQMGLAAVGEGELAGITTSLDVAGKKLNVVDLSGTDARTSQPTRTIAVMVPQPGQVWFYRLLGDPKLVEREKDNFTKFVQTVDYSHAH